MSLNAIQGILDNFLGTITSRYADHNGYWIFGLIVDSLSEISIELIEAPGSPNAEIPTEHLKVLAHKKFHEQLARGGFVKADVPAASLKITRSTTKTDGVAGGTQSEGYDVTFLVSAKASSGRVFESQRVVFVAPHDPKRELRSARPNRKD